MFSNMNESDWILLGVCLVVTFCAALYITGSLGAGIYAGVAALAIVLGLFTPPRPPE